MGIREVKRQKGFTINLKGKYCTQIQLKPDKLTSQKKLIPGSINTCIGFYGEEIFNKKRKNNNERNVEKEKDIASCGLPASRLSIAALRTFWNILPKIC